MIGIGRKCALHGSAMMLVLLLSSAAHAQCTGAVGAFGQVGFGSGAADAVAAVNSLVSVLNTSNTAFITQTNAFVGSPADAQPNQMGGGVWTRGVGGRVDNSSVGVVTIAPTPFFGIVPGANTITCDTKTRTDFGGYQAGVDVAKLNIAGVNVHFGATAGYVEANSKDISPPPASSFTGNFQVPFMGVYGVLTYGGFFLDAQVRGDFYEVQLSDPTNGVFGQNASARGTTFSSNVGYNQGFGGWFIEPSAGVVWSRVQVDPINVAGTLILGTGTGPPDSVHIGHIESILGRASVRFGTNFTAGNLSLQPFVTASVFHEFAGNVVTTENTSFASLGLPFPEVPATGTTSRVGTYGQFALGIAGQLLNTGWLGYARVDFRTGDNIEGVSVNGGLRYQFTPEQVAAIVSKSAIYKAPLAAAPVAYNWTGFYLGGYAGTTWGAFDWTFVVPPVFARVSPDIAGVLAGGQVGYNYQIGSTVIGIEGDLGWSNAKGARFCPDAVLAFFFTCENHMDRLATVTGRLGYAWERLLVYGKAGVAAANVTERVSFNSDSQPLIPPFVAPVPSAPSVSRTPVGWTLGAGFEVGLTPNWSAKAEYLYYDLGNEDFTFVTNEITATARIRETGNLVRVGLNYRFSEAPAPVVTKY